MPFRWSDVHTGNLDVPGFTIAGRTDEPVTSRGDAVAAIVQAGSQALNNMSVNHAIEREKRRQSAFLPAYFGDNQRGGMLAIAAIDVTRTGEMSAQRFMHLEIFTRGVFRTPRDAISVWLHVPRMNSALGEARYRFFWITRV